MLKFKKSLFAGVLDGGEKDVMFGGTRLTKFMETVEETTKAIPVEVSREHERPENARGGADPMANLVQTGLAFLQNLAAVSQEAKTGWCGATRRRASSTSSCRCRSRRCCSN